MSGGGGGVIILKLRAIKATLQQEFISGTKVRVWHALIAAFVAGALIF